MRFIVPILSRYGAIAVQFLIVAMITNSLSMRDTGIYFSIFGLILTTNFASGLGLPDGLVRACPPVAESNNRELVVTLLSSGLTIGFASIAGLSLAFGLFSAGMFGHYSLILPVSVWWASYGVTFLMSQTLVAAGYTRLGTFVFYSAINCGLLLVLLPYLALSSTPPLGHVLYVTMAGAAIAAFVSCTFVIVNVARPNRPQYSTELRAAWTTGLLIALGRIVQAAIIWSPVWVAGVIVDAPGAALIGLATRLVSAVAAVIAAIRFSIRPDLARDAAAGRWTKIEEIASRIAFWASLLALAAIGGTLLLGKPIITIVFGQTYQEAYVLVALFLLGTLGESIGGPVDEILKMSGRAKTVLTFQIFIVAIGLILQSFAATWFGLPGVAIGYAACLAALYAMQIIYLKKSVGIFVFPRIPRRQM